MPHRMDRNSDDNFYNQFSTTIKHPNSAIPSKTAFYSSTAHVDSNLNPRQLFWIKKRKIRREALDALMQLKDSNYIYESRHRHAMKRQRAASGRFLTKEELMKLNENGEK